LVTKIAAFCNQLNIHVKETSRKKVPQALILAEDW
jgi:hypothetical protein